LVVVVGDQVAVDDIGQVPFQAPAGLLRRLGLGEFVLVVGLPRLGSRIWRRTSPLEASTGAVPV
jgi:hypothetical protein